MRTSEAQKRAVKRSDAKNYYKIVARFPKPYEISIRKAAEEVNESLNYFIIRSVTERMEKLGREKLNKEIMGGKRK